MHVCGWYQHSYILIFFADVVYAMDLLKPTHKNNSTMRDYNLQYISAAVQYDHMLYLKNVKLCKIDFGCI